MHRSAIAWLLLLLLAVAAPGQAQPRPGAAPPCTAPAGPQQAVICGDAGLRAADARVLGLERAVAAATSRPATMAQRAAAFRRDLDRGEPGRPFDLDGLRDAYAERITLLEEQLRQDRAMRRLEQRRCPEGRRDCPPAGAFPRPPTLERACLGAVLRDCRVAAAGLVASEDGATRLLWQAQQGFTEQDGVRAGIVLLAEARGGWRLLAWSFEGSRFEAPRLVAEDGALLLHVAGRRGGSGAGNADLLLRLAPGGAAEVEMESWWDALPAALPPGLAVLQAVQYDIGRLTAEARLWRAEDGNCCPTGGRARLGFRLEGTRLVLAEVRAEAAARAQAAPPDSCPAERATYRLNAAAGFTAELRREGPPASDASDLVLRVRSAATGREDWFRFAAAQGYGGLSVLPIHPPGPSTAEDGHQLLDAGGGQVAVLDVFPIAGDLEVLDMPPQGGQPAPRHLFIPGLGRALHYEELPRPPGAPAGREAMPTAFWTLAACR